MTSDKEMYDRLYRLVQSVEDSDSYRAFKERARRAYGAFVPRHGEGPDPVNTYPLFWQIVQTVKSAYFSSCPIVLVKKSQKFRDNPSRVAGILAQNLLNSLVEQFPMRERGDEIVQDFVVAGLGASCVRKVENIYAFDADGSKDEEDYFEGEVVRNTAISSQSYGEKEPHDDTQEITHKNYTEEIVTEELCDFIAVPYDQILFNPEKGFDFTNHVTFKGFLTPADFQKHFEKPPISVDNSEKHSASEDSFYIRNDKGGKYCVVYEIHYKPDLTIYTISPARPGEILEKRKDPNKIRGFFPCAAPLLATLSRLSQWPIADYYYIEQIDRQLNQLWRRIHGVAMMLRLVILRETSQGDSSRVLKEWRSNDSEGMAVVNVQNFNNMNRKGGLNSMLQVVDMKPIASILDQLLALADRYENQAYKMLGINDLMRGTGSPYETKGTTELKHKYTAQRHRGRKDQVAEYFRKTLEIMFDMSMEVMNDETLESLMRPDTLSETDRMFFPEAMKILKSDRKWSYMIELETDSTISYNEEFQQEKYKDYLNAIMPFVDKSPDVAKNSPEFMPFLQESLRAVSQAHQAGQAIEGTLEKAMEGQKQRIQADAELRKENAKLKQELAATKQQLDNRLGELQIKLQDVQRKAEQDTAQALIKATQVKNDYDVMTSRVLVDAQHANNEERRVDIEAAKVAEKALSDKEKVDMEAVKLTVDTLNQERGADV